MIELYARLIIGGKRTILTIPQQFQRDVVIYLNTSGYSSLTKGYSESVPE